MNTRTRTLASFFTVAMAAMLVGAVVSTHIQRPTPAEARSAEPPAPVQAQTSATGPIGLDTFREIAKRYNPGVVNISTAASATRRRSRDPFWDFFDPDRGPGPERSRQFAPTGSGFVVDKDGYLLTNRHVIEEADRIRVTFPGGREYDAKLVGKDARTDVALLKIEPKGPLTVLDMGDSERSEVGEWVMAIGSPFGLGNSVTVGVVSYVGRPFDLASANTPVDMIQTDAAINPGNSGGPLLNSRGQVIGINTLIATQGVRQSAGVGFAVPINVAKDILPQLRDKGRVVRGWLGVSIRSVDEELARTYKLAEPKGAVVLDVTSGSPAEKANLRPEDVILAADDRVLEDNGALTRYIASRPPGTTVRLRVLRDGTERTIPVTLGTFPEGTAAQEESDSPEGSSRLGIGFRSLTPELAERLDVPRGVRGVVVTEIEPGSPAEDAGLQARDIVISVNGAQVSDAAQFESEINKAKGQGSARLRIFRGGAYAILVLRLSS